MKLCAPNHFTAAEAFSVVRRRSKKVFEFHEVALYFAVPLTEASEHLGVSVTHLKRNCRRLGIKKWPYKKLRRIKRRLADINGQMQTAPSAQEHNALCRRKQQWEQEKMKTMQEALEHGPNNDEKIKIVQELHQQWTTPSEGGEATNQGDISDMDSSSDGFGMDSQESYSSVETLPHFSLNATNSGIINDNGNKSSSSVNNVDKYNNHISEFARRKMSISAIVDPVTPSSHGFVEPLSFPCQPCTDLNEFKHQHYHSSPQISSKSHNAHFRHESIPSLFNSYSQTTHSSPVSAKFTLPRIDSIPFPIQSYSLSNNMGPPPSSSTLKVYGNKSFSTFEVTPSN